MQKWDIARHIHQQTGILEYEAAKVLDQILELFKIILQAGEPITIQGVTRMREEGVLPKGKVIEADSVHNHRCRMDVAYRK